MRSIFAAGFALICIGLPQLQAQRTPPRGSLSGQQAFSVCAGCHGLDGLGGEHGPNIATGSGAVHMSNAELLAVLRNGIVAGGMPAFGKRLDEQQLEAVVRYLRVLQGGTSNAKLTGNATAGGELFFGRAHCAECHMMNGKGGFLAADLSGYGASHSAEVIREAIVAPNKNPDVRHGTVTVLTRSGKRYSGIVRNEDNFSLQMQTSDGVFHLFEKADLAKIDRKSKSLMPADYEATLSSAELDDLISFLSQSTGGTASQTGEGNDE